MLYVLYKLLINYVDNYLCGYFIGEQEVRVLTLAEQIIAAMPDRIKVPHFFSINSL